MRPLRIAWFQTSLAWLLAAWLRLCLSTIRWQSPNREVVEAIWAAGGGVIVCFWHSRLTLAPASWSLERGQEPRVLVSLSRDGEFLARAVERIGFPAIRGSSAKKGAPDKAKGGAAAFRDGLRWIRQGGVLALTPDGPRGPVETMAEGAVMLARMSEAPVLLVGLACKPAITLDSWDRSQLPMPFGHGAIVYDGPIRIGRDTDIVALQTEWAARLSAATRQAEAML